MTSLTHIIDKSQILLINLCDVFVMIHRGVQKNRVTEKTEKTDEKLTEKTGY
jgi:hypothetical protein